MIKVRNLLKSYDNNIVALNSVSFGIQKGEICGYIGVNGAGKSTTVKVLSGLLEFNSGEIEICGLKLPENSLELKKIIGYVPESSNLFASLKVNEFFEFIGDVHKISGPLVNKRVKYFSELFDFGEYLTESIGILSKGNRQKVLITSSLMHNPDVLFLDEPHNGLDANSIIILQEIIIILASKGKTVFYCSHLLDLIEKISTKIIIIEKGNIILDKSSAELKESKDYTNLETLFRGLNTDKEIKKFSYEEIFS